ncbi:hypothetical protein A3A03_00115 [Candidatus Nomurabacteria bacterium RIFCSPLOWO2_01_FULL_40_18]|uniref:Uncharacterized protein n=1 Tax=Candidatus Nomurabacteria bacterium RIFCSPLOWO2_01_FULL_40_18 TaxID=1801773 RepID=A0A1F6XKV1_9BACT|nr:MAG: hypothetical protein A3A03_00115 [Candidatus Nomurabacteria bacterium RIFCSPLOWO2_01_FULL_40_18]
MDFRIHSGIERFCFNLFPTFKSCLKRKSTKSLLDIEIFNALVFLILYTFGFILKSFRRSFITNSEYILSVSQFRVIFTCLFVMPPSPIKIPQSSASSILFFGILIDFLLKISLF